jgi:hypothetical protein
MKRIFLIFILLNVCFSYSKSAPAASPWPDKVKVGGEFRARVESQINYDFTTPTPDNDTFVLLRTRVYLDLNPLPILQLFAMYQDSETLGQDSALIPTPDGHKFYQGFLLIKVPDALGFRAKAGRFEMIYGDQRLIGNNYWNNLGRSFDGGVLHLENTKFWLDIFGTRINVKGVENQFAGVYGHWKKLPGGEAEPYVIFLHNDNGGLNMGELSLVTLGTRVTGKFKKKFDYGFEGAYQTGESGGNQVSAFAFHAKLGYTFPVKLKPRLGVEFNFASGDANPTAGTVTTFNNLFPTNHDKYGYMDLFAWKNLEEFWAGLVLQPATFMKVFLDYHLFFLPEPVNGQFLANGAQGRAGSATASPFAGQEIDVNIRFEPIKYFEGWIGYSAFFPGGFFRDTGGGDVAQFFYTQVTGRY